MGIRTLSYLAGILLLFTIAGSACRQAETSADLPDIQSIYGNIAYLDSLLGSPAIDSITGENDRLADLIEKHRPYIANADEQSALDSLSRILATTQQFLRYCTDTRQNLEVLNQDVKAVELSYISGKMQKGPYINTLLEAEQILINLQAGFSDGYQQALHNKVAREKLMNWLTPLPENQTGNL
jgi:hypothetical protein